MKNTCQYRIRINGCLNESWAEWFDNFSIEQPSENLFPVTTCLTGLVPDQAALFGVLIKIRDLNLELISVERIDH
jgi:hypothetical protein